MSFGIKGMHFHAINLFLNKYLCLYKCGYMHVCQSVHAKVRGQLQVSRSVPSTLRQGLLLFNTVHASLGDPWAPCALYPLCSEGKLCPGAGLSG